MERIKQMIFFSIDSQWRH